MASIIKFKRVAPSNVAGYTGAQKGELMISYDYMSIPAAVLIGDDGGNKTLLNPLKYTTTQADDVFAPVDDGVKLDEDGKVPLSVIPAGDYIDLEFIDTYDDLPNTGVAGVIYFIADTDKEFVWLLDQNEGGRYVEINQLNTDLDGGTW